MRQKSTLHITSLEETACGVVFVTHPLNTWVSDLCVSVENFFGYFCYDLMYNYLSVWPYILTNIIFFQRYIYIYRISLSAYQYKYKIWPTMLNLSLEYIFCENARNIYILSIGWYFTISAWICVLQEKLLPLVKQELFTLPEYLSSPWVFTSEGGAVYSSKVQIPQNVSTLILSGRTWS